MGKKNADDALFWRSIRLHKLSLIRHALQQTNGVLKAAAVYLGIGESNLRREVAALEADGHQVRDGREDVGAKESPPAPEEPVPAVEPLQEEHQEDRDGDL